MLSRRGTKRNRALTSSTSRFTQRRSIHVNNIVHTVPSLRQSEDIESCLLGTATKDARKCLEYGTFSRTRRGYRLWIWILKVRFTRLGNFLGIHWHDGSSSVPRMALLTSGINANLVFQGRIIGPFRKKKLGLIRKPLCANVAGYQGDDNDSKWFHLQSHRLTHESHRPLGSTVHTWDISMYSKSSLLGLTLIWQS